MHQPADEAGSIVRYGGNEGGLPITEARPRCVARRAFDGS
jgi:hypothetical protein